MRQFSRKKINAHEWLQKMWSKDHLSHVTYCPDMRMSDAQFRIIRGQSHDGTVGFTLDLIREALTPVVNMQAYYIPNEPEDWSKVKRITYQIGPAWLLTAYGRVALKAGIYPGQRERVLIPVISEVQY